eukprot:gene8189-7380_t
MRELGGTFYIGGIGVVLSSLAVLLRSPARRAAVQLHAVRRRARRRRTEGEADASPGPDGGDQLPPGTTEDEMLLLQRVLLQRVDDLSAA